MIAKLHELFMGIKLKAKKVGTNNRFLDMSDNSEGADVYILIG